ncbi:MAG: hypothetical protein ACOYN3_08470 [Acidimicrobiia bacterium]
MPDPQKFGYNNEMRFRTGVIIGLAVGYYLGTRAGRERYEQIQAGLRSLADGALGAKVRAGVELGIERLRGIGEEIVLTDEPLTDPLD